MLKLPSECQFGQKVDVDLIEQGVLRDGVITGVHFKHWKVLYDVEFVVRKNDLGEGYKEVTTRIHNVDSVFVCPLEKLNEAGEMVPNEKYLAIRSRDRLTYQEARNLFYDFCKANPECEPENFASVEMAWTHHIDVLFNVAKSNEDKG